MWISVTSVISLLLFSPYSSSFKPVLSAVESNTCHLLVLPFCHANSLRTVRSLLSVLFNLHLDSTKNVGHFHISYFSFFFLFPLLLSFKGSPAHRKGQQATCCLLVFSQTNSLGTVRSLLFVLVIALSYFRPLLFMQLRSSFTY